MTAYSRASGKVSPWDLNAKPPLQSIKPLASIPTLSFSSLYSFSRYANIRAGFINMSYHCRRSANNNILADLYAVYYPCA